MPKKKIVVDTDREKGKLYYISDSSGTFYVYKYREWSSDDNIGQARTFADALEIVKAHVSGTVRNLRIE